MEPNTAELLFSPATWASIESWFMAQEYREEWHGVEMHDVVRWGQPFKQVLCPADVARQVTVHLLGWG